MTGLPPQIILEVTRRCNYRCPFCYCVWHENKGKLPRELDTAAWKEIIAEVSARDAKSLLFTGGEALLRSDIDELLSYARKLFPQGDIELFTNGNSYNYGNWVSDEYTELVAKAKTLPGSAERDELLSSAEKLMFGEGGYPVAPVYFYTQTYCVNDAAVKNVGWTPLGYFMFHYATQE